MTFIQGHITQVNVMLIQAGHFFFKQQKKKMIPSGLINHVKDYLGKLLF